jgi:hypothetical protein
MKEHNRKLVAIPMKICELHTNNKKISRYER